MRYESDKNEQSVDGLRYATKATGSPYRDSAGHARMSCFLCGKFEQRSLGVWKMVLGQKRFCCGVHSPRMPSGQEPA